MRGGRKEGGADSLVKDNIHTYGLLFNFLLTTKGSLLNLSVLKSTVLVYLGCDLVNTQYSELSCHSPPYYYEDILNSALNLQKLHARC